jgi:hypothetical protein
MYFNCQEKSVKKLAAVPSLIRPENGESNISSEHHSLKTEDAEKVLKKVQMGDTEAQT